VGAWDWIILGGGGRRTKIKIAPRVLELLGGDVVENLAVERRETPSSR